MIKFLLGFLVAFASAKDLVGASFIVFRLESAEGSMKIKSLDEAEALCIANGALISENWRVRDAIKLKHWYGCQPCGWCKQGRNFRPRCGHEVEAHYSCADDPTDEGRGVVGYDVYCFGDVSPDMPPDAVAINVGEDRGYVFAVEEGEIGVIIPTESLAKTACNKRGASLASRRQVDEAWYNGFSQCVCAWMMNHQDLVMNDRLAACGDDVAFMACHYGDIRHAICFMSADLNPQGDSAIDFGYLVDGQMPVGVEKEATLSWNGYVYPTKSVRGEGRTDSLFFALKTCREQGAMLADEKQLKKAMWQGLTWCKCGWVWANAVVNYGVMVEAEDPSKPLGKLQYSSRWVNDECGPMTGVIDCEMKPDTPSDVWCFKHVDINAPPIKAWNIPPDSVRIHGGRVYHVEHRDGKYKLADQWFANKECSRNFPGGISSTRAQLEQAMAHGLTKCRCGYVQEEDVYIPMYRLIESCGDFHGLLLCPDPELLDVPEQGPLWDAWCFISDADLDREREDYILQ